MSEKIKLGSLNFPAYILGGFLISSFSTAFGGNIKHALVFTTLWTAVYFTLLNNHKTIWYEHGFLHLKKMYKEIKLYSNDVTISIRAQSSYKTEISISTNEHSENISLPFYFPEEQKKELIEKIENFCQKHNIKYTLRNS